ncbi:hypothetical protein [Akkermansia muciniphila]|uniref:hypothetical protein n=1 Tax=Akkermansia muciniphila TaxID=239935 RepID=UPI0015C60DED|nr:hypothetical protein [Akkermansia muciniphila]
MNCPSNRGFLLGIDEEGVKFPRETVAPSVRLKMVEELPKMEPPVFSQLTEAPLMLMVSPLPGTALVSQLAASVQFSVPAPPVHDTEEAEALPNKAALINKNNDFFIIDFTIKKPRRLLDVNGL